MGQADPKVITRSDVRAILSKLVEAPVLANAVLASASAIFSWAVDQEIITVNPCTGIERNQSTSRERVLSDKAPRFWSAFSELDLMRGAALKALLLPGQRPGEVAHMRRNTSSMAGGKCRVTPITELAGPVPRTDRHIECGCRRQCKT